MTTASITERVRRLVQDTESPYHWSDAQIKSDVQLAVRALHRLRPETRYVDGKLVDEVTLPAAANDSIDVNERYFDCLAYYAAHIAYSDDCTDPVSKKLSDDFLSKFNGLAQL